ncbi:DUF5324 family protein [Streptomyces bluensis]|uniref:DUF5324 family protein n=1 Tax=Streptomyces bluensis TaxID=33897 RepID=UPI001062FE65|nr:DUF5324 family protein [Streptomyces bluensis]GGZ83946.1 hypothetical protein GCM10010344_58940 [Streptomyces bluensis]
MTRKDSVRAAAESAKDSVRHAAEVVAPYADTAKDRAAYYSHEARVRLAPRVSLAAEQARHQYGAHVAPRLGQARSHVPPKVDYAAHEAAVLTRKAVRQAAGYTVPAVERAVTTARPVREAAASGSVAALAALRGQVSPRQIQKLVRRQQRRARASRIAKGMATLGALVGGALVAWKWWDRQANPDWLVEPPAATEVPDSSHLASVDGSGQSPLDPEVQAKDAEEKPADRDDRR